MGREKARTMQAETLKWGDKMAVGEEQIKAMLTEFWEEAGSMKADDARFDQKFAEDIESRIRKLLRGKEEAPGWCEREWTTAEVKAAVQSMAGKHFKAPGLDGICPWMLARGGEQAIEALRYLFMEIWKLEVMPRVWQGGYVKYIYKGKGSIEDLDSYRPITLLSVTGKLFTVMWLYRMEPLLDSKLAEEQGGFRKKRGCRDQVWTLSQTLQYGRTRDTHACFVDLKKAYDTVWRGGMWHLLHEYGVRGKLWRMVVKWYENSAVVVDWNGVVTEPIKINIGVRQGCPLSPILFAIYINELAWTVKELEAGVQVKCREYRVVVKLLLYADDVVLLAKSREEMEILLARMHEHWVKWRGVVNTKKSNVMSVGKVKPQTWKYGVDVLQTCQQYGYLGVTVKDTLTWGAWVVQLKAKVYASLPALKRTVRVAGPGVASTAWLQVIRPRLEHGAEACYLPKIQVEELEQLQRKAARLILGLPRSTNNALLYGELGWMPISARRTVAQVAWLVHIRLSNDERLIKRLYEVIFQSLGAAAEKKRSWIEAVYTWLDQAGLVAWMFCPPEDIPKEWKMIIKSAVRDSTLRQWRADMAASEARLGVYRRVVEYPGQLSRWVKLGWSNAEVKWWTMLRGGLIDMGVDRRRKGEGSEQCTCGTQESAHHVLMECVDLASERWRLVQEVQTSLPPSEQARDGWEKLSTEGRLLVTLGRLIPGVDEVQMGMFRNQCLAGWKRVWQVREEVVALNMVNRLFGEQERPG